MRPALAAVLAVVAVAALVLAHDVRSGREALERGDAAYRLSPSQAAWASSRVLGTDDDVAFRRAVQLYVRTLSTPKRLDIARDRAELRAQAETALAGVAHGVHASQAETLLGVLAFEKSAADAIAAFTDAVRADPTNTAAKYDLELLLRLTAARGSREGGGPGGSFGRGGRRGAGSGVPGSGY